MLQGALDTIWHVRQRRRGLIRTFIVSRLFSVAMVFLVMLFLLTSLLLTTLLSRIRQFGWGDYAFFSRAWQARCSTLRALFSFAPEALSPR
jgi:uncharacterized BrkB/YihY/UPF0761 family membrane protein